MPSHDVMPNMELYQPETLDDALAIADRLGERGWLVGGGQDTYGWLKDRAKSTDALVDLGAIESLRGVRQDGDTLEIGAMTTLTEVATDPVIRERYSLLADAAAIVASPQIRNIGTIGGNVSQDVRCWYYRRGLSCYRAGGNLCYADTPQGMNREHSLFEGSRCVAAGASDTAPALVALNASMVIRNSGGEREVSAEDFFVGPARDILNTTIMRPGDILTAIRLPADWRDATFYFEKVADRNVWDFSLVSIAAAFRVEGGGIAGRKLEVPVVDTESNPAAGARKLRSLIQRSRARFVVGSVHSGIMLASIPIATELKTPYFSAGEATEATGSRGSRYSFRTGTDTYALAAAGAPWAFKNLGKNWTMIFPDYAWGHSHHQEHRKLIESMGGKVNDPIAVPLGTKDLVPYLAKIPEETEVLFSVFFGALSVAFYTQSKAMRLDEKMKMYSVSGTIEAIHPKAINGAAENVYFLENFPRPLEYKNDEHHKKFIEMMNIDPVHAQENGSDRVMAKSHAWQSYENFFVLKKAIEASGWQRKKDTPGAIQALEGLEMDNSLAHPQGAKLLRGEDHSGVIDCYMSQVLNDKFVVKRRIPRAEMESLLPPRFDFRKQKL